MYKFYCYEIHRVYFSAVSPVSGTLRQYEYEFQGAEPGAETLRGKREGKKYLLRGIANAQNITCQKKQATKYLLGGIEFE